MIAGIQQKIRQIREQGLDIAVFGKEAHFNPPLCTTEVLEIEKQLSITLPNDYREFITSVGNGGFGPGLGLISFGSGAVIDPRIPRTSNYRINVVNPFPYTSDWNYDPLRLAMEEESPRTDELMDYYFSVERIQGSICIGNIGCGAINLLVLNGNERGNVWEDYRGTFGGICPATRSKRESDHISFTKWYDVWLSEIILGLSIAERHII